MWTKSKQLTTAILAVSLAINVLLVLFLALMWYHKSDVTVPECRLYPEHECPVDFPATLRDAKPLFDAYSIRGEPMRFLEFTTQGTLSESVESKYGSGLPVEMVRNIQMLAYFLLDYQVRLTTGDRLALFYRSEDNKILYLRLRSRSYNAVFEAFLYQKGETGTESEREVYLTADGSVIPPCIKNSPFPGCPPVRLEKRHETLVPLFLVPFNTEVRFPFDAWVINVTDFTKTGGAVQVTFPDHGVVGFFEYLGTVNPKIKRGHRYKAGTIIGTSGFAKREGKDGVRYYLERRDGTPISPFFFHHAFHETVPAEERANVTITQSFYRNWYRQAQMFERSFY